MFNHFKKWRQQRLKLKLWQREQAKHLQRQHAAWTRCINCLCCHALIPQDARFCPMCGVPLQGTPTQNTGPIVATERPLVVYRRHLHPTVGPDTQVHHIMHFSPSVQELLRTDLNKRIDDTLKEHS
jgi:hypothetical protein